MYKVEKNTILKNEKITNDLYLMKVKGDFSVKEGQFFMLKAENSFMTLFRPISIFDADEEGVSFLYSIRGKGTEFFSKMEKGQEILMHGPYGNGFPKPEGNLVLVGGGIGMAPLYLTAKRNKDSVMYVGLRENQYNEEEMANLMRIFEGVNVCFKVGGFVTDAVDFENYDTVFTCGPEIMMKIAAEKGKNVYVSLERHMGCGVGACLSCSCKAEDKMVKVCSDGPVFHSKEVRF